MRRGWLGALLLAVLTGTGCTQTSPRPSEAAAGACAAELAPRTSPTDYPVAVLHVGGEDLPPVVGEVEWLGDAEPVSTAAPRAIHLERFTVLQVAEATQLALRMTDGVSIAAWRVEALPNATFRSGDTDGGEEWASGDEPAELVCVPIVAGEWVVRADLTFADDDGHGTFYWRLNVGG
jgi:hypothetical protein